MFNLVFHTPEIPGNTGNAIRLAAVTGSHLHLVEPLGFDLEEKKVRRAGLDYHDMAHVNTHRSLEEFWEDLGVPDNNLDSDGDTCDKPSVYAFTTYSDIPFTDISYMPGDILLFGKESAGLGPDILVDTHITKKVRIPMLDNRRSLNLGNAASIAVYEAWRQNNFNQAH